MGQSLIFSLIDKAIFDYNLIEKGDRLLLAASGGKDSTVLVEYFANRLRRPGISFSLKTVHIETEITKPLSPELTEIFSSWNIQCENIKVDVLGRLKQGKKMNCFWCSTQRRTELIKYALDNNYNKLVLGHHMDDMLETLLMNMLEKGELSTMAPLLKYQKYPLTVIRPLCYVTEDKIIEHAQKSGYISQVCTCTYQENSFRKEARKKLEFLTGGDPVKKQHMFDSLKNILTEYLP
ncbi:MAG: tRNA 2-thiocytidine biosynthesis protein TtcA [Treponema sp.]|nr:tRNA 2-thiocytidine biosynthesis protein TtcA [Treponema sp.]